MASLLLAAGAPGERRALPHSRIMLHQPSGGYQGQATDIRIHTDEILRLREIVNGIYAHHTGRPVAEIAETLERDTFQSPVDAVAFGILDQVVEQRPPVGGVAGGKGGPRGDLPPRDGASLFRGGACDRGRRTVASPGVGGVWREC